MAKKTDNDILAEYVRENYPKIERSLEFAMYKMGKRIKENAGTLGRLKEALKEKNNEP